MIIAGDKQLIDGLAPLLRLISRTQVYVGDVGRAAEVEALVNMVMAANTAALAEGLGLGAGARRQPGSVREISDGRGRVARPPQRRRGDAEARAHRPCSPGARGQGTGIAISWRAKKASSLPITEATHRQYQMMVDVGPRAHGQVGDIRAHLCRSPPQVERDRGSSAKNGDGERAQGVGARCHLQRRGFHEARKLGIGRTERAVHARDHEFAQVLGAHRGSDQLAYNVHAYDLRGHGDSAAVHGPMSFERIVQDCIEVCDLIPGGVDTLLGHSWGGAIAIMAGLRLGVSRIVALARRSRTAEGIGKRTGARSSPALRAARCGARTRAARTHREYLDIEIAAKIHAMGRMTIGRSCGSGARTAPTRGRSTCARRPTIRSRS